MNVNDVPQTEQPTDDMLKLIFQRQAELMTKYHDIERDNGLMLTPDVPVDLNDRFGQQRLKDFAWRTTEELAESLEAYASGDKLHAREETADALHFLIELCILAGMDHESVSGKPMFVDADHLEFAFQHAMGIVTPREAALRVVESLGLAMNCLKNKPWKQTHILTDEGRFKSNVRRAFYDLVAYATAVGHSHDSMFDMYFRKSEVNKFRQRSQY